MTRALGLLSDLRRHGALVQLEAGRLRLRSRGPVPPDLMAQLREHRHDVAALLLAAADRVPTFEAQARRPGPLPLLALPGLQPAPGTCLSCGGVLTGDSWRCPACVVAAWQALETFRHSEPAPGAGGLR